MAQASYNQGNSTATVANTAINNAASASLYANAGITLAQAAYNQANTAGGADQYARDTANSAGLYANSGITLAQAAYNEANLKFNSSGGVITGNVTISNSSDLTVTGNLIILGNTSYVSANDLIVNDPMIILANGNFTDAVDIGFVAHYGPEISPGQQRHTGFFRHAETNEYYVFYNYDKHLEAGNNTIIIEDASFIKSNINADVFKGNLIANSVIVDGRNLYTFGTSAYDQANASINLAQSAYNAQNSTAIVANSAITADETVTLTNKRITQRVANNGVTTSGSITPTANTADQYNIIGLTGTANIQIPSGTPTDGQKLNIRIKDNGVGRTLTWVTSGSGAYRPIGVTLPTSTTANKTIYVGCVYNATDDDWDVVAVASEV